MHKLDKIAVNLWRQPLFIIVLLFASSKIFFLSRYHLPIWDEAVYLGMGKYIYSAGQAGLWEILRPVGLPLVTGLAWKLHLPQVLFSEIISLAFGIGSIILCYLIANRLFGRKVAILSAALFAASPIFFLYSSYILTEVPSAFFALAAIYAFIRNRYFLCGAMAALSMLFKFPNALIIFAIAATVIFSVAMGRSDIKSRLLTLAKACLSFMAVTLPFLIFNYVFYRPFTSNAFDSVFRPFILGAWHQSNPSKAISGQLYNYSFYVVQALKQHFVIIFILAAVFLFWRKKWFRDSGKLLLGIFLAIYLAYFSYILNKDERFLILFLPALCIFSAVAFMECFSYLKRRKSRLMLVSCSALLLLSFGFAAYNDFSFHSWRQGSEPLVAAELYRSVSNLGITGPVLTSEPVFAAYNDNRFFPYYFTSYDGIPAELKPLNEWEQNASFEAVIFSEKTLFCPETDFECQAARSNMLPYLSSKFRQVFNDTYYDGAISYFVFVNESYRER